MKKKITFLLMLSFIGLSIGLLNLTKASAQGTLDSGLVAKYYFNGNANDESGNGNNGTVNGATLTTDRFGNADKAYSFDGSTNFIEIPYSNSFAFDVTQAYSFGGWIYANILNGEHAFISKDGVCSEISFGTNFYNDQTCLTAVHCQEPNCWMSSSRPNVITGKWYHIFTTVNNNNLKFYIDGNLINDTTLINVSWGINRANASKLLTTQS